LHRPKSLFADKWYTKNKEMQKHKCNRSESTIKHTGTWDRAYRLSLFYYDVICTCHIHWATVYKKFRPMLSARCPVCAVLSVCNVGVLWPNGWMDQDETWHAVGLGPGHIVLDGNPALPPPKGAQPLPSFRPMSTVAKRLDRSRCHLVWR